MKKMMGGKTYNTETAEEIATWSNSYYRSDFHYCQETMYKTKRGAYFIHGKGGPLSQYRQPSGGRGWTGGEDILIMDKEAAFNWLQDTDQIEAAEKEFSDMIEEA